MEWRLRAINAYTTWPIGIKVKAMRWWFLSARRDCLQKKTAPDPEDLSQESKLRKEI